MEQKLKHLEFIQSAITRMAQNSFLLKGWVSTIAGVVIGLSTDDYDLATAIATIIIIVIFWILDGYYVFQERYFRGLYDEVRQKSENKIDFSMKLNNQASENISWRKAITSKTVLPLYIGLIIAVCIITTIRCGL